MHRTMVRSRPRPSRASLKGLARGIWGRARGIKSPAGLSRSRPKGRGHMSKVPRAEKS